MITAIASCPELSPLQSLLRRPCKNSPWTAVFRLMKMSVLKFSLRMRTFRQTRRRSRITGHESSGVEGSVRERFPRWNRARQTVLRSCRTSKASSSSELPQHLGVDSFEQGVCKLRRLVGSAVVMLSTASCLCWLDVIMKKIFSIK